MSKDAPDLGADPFYRWLNSYHYVPLTLLGFALLAIGGWPLVLWGSSSGWSSACTAPGS